MMCKPFGNRPKSSVPSRQSRGLLAMNSDLPQDRMANYRPPIMNYYEQQLDKMKNSNETSSQLKGGFQNIDNLI